MLRPEKHQRADNAKSLATSLLANNPILSRETAERVAGALVELTEGWRPWTELPARVSMPMVIVGRDCLGYVHEATHLIEGFKRRPDNPSWLEDWRQVTV